MLKIFKEDVILKAKFEGKRHRIQEDRVEKIISETLKKIGEIINFEIKINLISDISDEMVLDNKLFEKMVGENSNISESEKICMKEYRRLTRCASLKTIRN